MVKVVARPNATSLALLRKIRDDYLLNGEKPDTAPAPPVKTSTPVSVTKTMCSNCAVRLPSADSYPSPLNYMGYPKSVCTSVNEVICHGIPDSRKLEEGDIVNLDVTCYIDGVHGDTNATFAVGEIDDESRALIKATEECTWRGIEAVKSGRPLSDIGRAIEDHAKLHKLGVVRAFVGHGIGEQFHTDIQVLHYFDSRNSVVMRPGMTFTIEPMITLGTWQHKMWDDEWTAVTADGKRTAQFEHMVLVT
ncbi:MAG: type I methionyl aminopeptidase, partial [Actinobacteria bacterium]|nr:type I methionyl aminopeptidase [Actinomycetota bacterium]